MRPTSRNASKRQRLNALVALCESPRCRRQTLLAYFGEAANACGNCDLCIDGVTVVDATIEAQKAMSAILRTGERFGTEHLVSLLCGEETEGILRFGHQKLPTFGVGREHAKPQWRSIFRQLYAAGIIAMDIGGYGRWSVTERGRAVLKGTERLDLRQDALVPAGSRRRRITVATAGEGDPILLDALKKRRTGLAREQGVPAYVILPDRSLMEMAQQRPTTAAAMSQVHGVGQAKLARYGDAFLDVIRHHVGGVPAP